MQVIKDILIAAVIAGWFSLIAKYWEALPTWQQWQGLFWTIVHGGLDL